MTSSRGRFETLWRWRQASVWAPVLWFPVMLFGLLTGRTALALTIGLAGLVFAGLTRAVVWLGRCPDCEKRWSDSSGGFQRFWDKATCPSCGLSLFDLRRGVRSTSKASGEPMRAAQKRRRES